jgi:hypothetical protein
MFFLRDAKIATIGATDIGLFKTGDVPNLVETHWFMPERWYS